MYVQACFPVWLPSVSDPKFLKYAPTSRGHRRCTKLRSYVLFGGNRRTLDEEKLMLYVSNHRGGLGLPNLQAYFQSAQIAQLSYTVTKGPKALWVSIEALSCSSFTIGSLMWLPSQQHPPILCPTLSHLLAVWDRAGYCKSLSSLHTPLAIVFFLNRGWYLHHFNDGSTRRPAILPTIF